jgi:hypothetical protein
LFTEALPFWSNGGHGEAIGTAVQPVVIPFQWWWMADFSVVVAVTE